MIVRFLELTYVEGRQYLPGQAHEFEVGVAEGLIKEGVAQEAEKPMPKEKEEKPKKAKK